MNRFTSTLLKLMLGVAAICLLSTGTAAAGKIPVNLRVVTHKGKTLFDGKVKTGTAKIKPNSDCLGGSAGKARTLTGPTALGALADASKASSALRPMLVSDGDFGFGLCGFGKTVAKAENWWVLKYNHTDSMLGGEATKLKKNSDVLWYLAKSYNETTPNELVLDAPAKVRKGASFKVRVFEYDGKGKRKPVEGAKISGASAALTDAKGYTKISLSRKTRISAQFAGTIPSNRAVIQIRK
ncbi:MAG TPA: hypothetical protein VMF31_00115 [Solirubrobacterales bacterium]|nr:hypothetical protein [Solirubrobacterales bacterium]